MKSIFYPSDERGKGDYGWLTTRYSFSFANWYDPTKMGFGALRVLNDDVIAGGKGFATHGHQNMEIITIVMKGSVRHTDSMGNSYIVHEGDVQVMSAGTGVRHGEENGSGTEPLELFQLWITPKVINSKPRYDQRNFNFLTVKNDIIPLVGGEGLTINQDAYISYGTLTQEESITYTLQVREGNGVFILVIEGEILLGGQILKKRDQMGITEVHKVFIQSDTGATFLIIEVPME